MKKIITNLKSKKSKLVAGTTALILAAPSAVLADDTGTANTMVTEAFDTLKADAIATMTPIGIAAVGIMGIFLAWKYGRKIFNMVAK